MEITSENIEMPPRKLQLKTNLSKNLPFDEIA